MQTEEVKPVMENSGVEATLEALGMSIARFSDKKDPRTETAIPGL